MSPKRLAGAAFAIACLPYLGVVHNKFFMDSERAILLDPSLRSPRSIPSYFKEEFFQTVPSEGWKIGHLRYYRPIVKLLHLLEYQVFGTHPVGYNVIDIALNALVVLLGFLFVLATSENVKVAFSASVLYAVNPARVEAVAWATGVSSVLMALFCLGALLCHRRGKGWASLALVALALLSRESAVLFPLALVLHEVLLARRRMWEALKRAAPFVAMTLVYLLVRLAALGTPPLTRLGPGTILDAAVVIVKRYVKIFFWPDAPVTQYSLPPAGLPRGEILTAYGVVAVLLALGVWLWRERKAACFWYLWFFLWFALNLNVGAIGEYLLAEKELYLGGLGFCVLMATGADRLRTRWAWAPLLALATLHAWTTFDRSRYWRDGLTHLQKATEFAPDFYLFQYDLGNEYARRDRCGEAVDAYRKALRQKPDLSLAENNMANCLFRLGEYDSAVTAWRRALEADPQNPNPYFNMALAWERKGDLARAMTWFRTYLRLVPAPSTPALAHIASVERQLAERAERPVPAH